LCPGIPRGTMYAVAKRPPPTQRGSLGVIVGAFAVSVTLAGALVAILWSPDSPGAGWVRLGSVEDVRARGVTSLPHLSAYVVANPPRTPIAFVARSTHLGERIVYCESSMWFEDRAHGTKFDRLGNYATGPAPRGLDRLATTVLDGVVWVNPNEITVGPPRGAHPVEPPTGPFCSH
jgi:hypothetical protein